MRTNEFRNLGHRVVDLLADYLDHIEEKRVFPDVEPGTLNRLFAESLPQDPSSAESVLNELDAASLAPWSDPRTGHVAGV
jgi:hypothetical protein